MWTTGGDFFLWSLRKHAQRLRKVIRASRRRVSGSREKKRGATSCGESRGTRGNGGRFLLSAAEQQPSSAPLPFSAPLLLSRPLRTASEPPPPFHPPSHAPPGHFATHFLKVPSRRREPIPELIPCSDNPEMFAACSKLSCRNPVFFPLLPPHLPKHASAALTNNASRHVKCIGNSTK